MEGCFFGAALARVGFRTLFSFGSVLDMIDFAVGLVTLFNRLGPG